MKKLIPSVIISLLITNYPNDLIAQSDWPKATKETKPEVR